MLAGGQRREDGHHHQRSREVASYALMGVIHCIIIIAEHIRLINLKCNI